MELTSRALAEYSLGVSIDDLPDDVVDQADRLTLDTLGCAIGAFSSPPSKRLRTTYGGKRPEDGGATLLGTDRRLPTEYAALVNATMGRYLDFNDCYTTGSSACHPSDHIPALLSVAEAEGATGADLVEAIVVAFEIQCRGVDTGLAWNNGFDYVTWGVHAAAAAAGKLMGLSEDELTNAIGIAAASSNALLISRLGEVSMWKAVAQPYGTHNAIQACGMARDGLTGPAHVFEGVEERGGEGGFFDAVAGGPVEFEAMGGRGGGYRITETSFKAFSCGYFTHPSVTAVLDLVEEHDIAPEDVEGIEVRTFDHAVQVYASGPEKWATDMSRETADHSLPYNVSVAVLDREVIPRQYGEEYLRDERVHALMGKVDVEEDAELTAYRREHPRHVPAAARIEANGETYETRVDYPLGHPERPMSDEAIEEKVRGLTEEYLSDDQIDRAIELCHDLDGAGGVEPLVEALRI